MPQLHHCTPLSLLLLALLLHIAGSPVTHAIILFFGFGSMVLVENPPLETRVWHGRLSSRELTRIGPAPCHVSVGVGIGSTGSSFKSVLSTKAGYILPGVCFVYVSIPPVNQFVFKTWPFFTLGIHFLRRIYLVLLLAGNKQVVGQGVAGRDS